MSGKYDDLVKAGGPMHPFVWKYGDGSEVIYPGATLRDWFAGQALAGMTSVPVDVGECADRADFDARCQERIRDLCRCAYSYADAMLAERERDR